MTQLKATTRRELIRRLRALGYDGPFSGGRHEFMLKGHRRLVLPNPNRSDIGVDLLRRILSQGGISLQEWESSRE